MISQLKFILAGANVRRFHTRQTLVTETNGHHSHGVACIIELLYPNCRKQLIVAALYHDIAECEAGDLPAPMKRETGIREAVKKYEHKLHEDANLPLPDLDDEEKRRLELADGIHGAIFCLQECRRGNVEEMKPMFLKYLAYINTLAFTIPEKGIYEWLNNQPYANNRIGKGDQP